MTSRPNYSNLFQVLGRVLIWRSLTKHLEFCLSSSLLMRTKSLWFSKVFTGDLPWTEQAVFSTSLATMFRRCMRKACTKGLAENPQLWPGSEISSSCAQISCNHVWDLNNLLLSFTTGSSMSRKASLLIRLKSSSCHEPTHLPLQFKPGRRWTQSGRMLRRQRLSTACQSLLLASSQTFPQPPSRLFVSRSFNHVRARRS